MGRRRQFGSYQELSPRAPDMGQACKPCIPLANIPHHERSQRAFLLTHPYIPTTAPGMLVSTPPVKVAFSGYPDSETALAVVKVAAPEGGAASVDEWCREAESRMAACRLGQLGVAACDGICPAGLTIDQ